MKILVLVNTLTSINSFVHSNHLELFMHTRKKMPDLEIIHYHPHRTSIDRARNSAALQAMEMGCDYLLFLDDDVLVPADAIIKLLDADKDIVAGFVYIRGFPFNVMAFKSRKDPEKPDEEERMMDLPIEDVAHMNDLDEMGIPKLKLDDNGMPIVDCDAVGFSLCLINMNVIKAMVPPYFITGTNFTEDVYFCNKARELLRPVPTIAMRSDIQCGHMMPQEPVEFKTVEFFRTFYTSIRALELLETPEAPELVRDKEHIARCLDVL